MKDILLGSSPAGKNLYATGALRRQCHSLILGAPGYGKSKFLEHTVRQCIAEGSGCLVLDPHGSLFDDLRRWCTYHHFLGTRRIILLDPSSGDYVTPFNPFLPKKDQALDVQVDGMAQALLRVWGAADSQQTPTLDRLLRLLFAAMIVGGFPLHEAFSLVCFEERELREEVIERFTEPILQLAWREVQTLQQRGQWREEVLSTANRLFRLAASATVRRFLGVMDPGANLDLYNELRAGSIVLVNLKPSGYLSRENSKALAALLLNDLFRAAIADPDTRQARKRPVSVVVDEWPTVATPDIELILAEARKFGILLHLANQTPAQIEGAFSEPFLRHCFGTTGIKVVFGGLSRRDALRLAEEMLVGQVDLKEIKDEIWQTKTLPVLTRQKVFTESRSSAQGMGEGEMEATAEGIFEATGTSEFESAGESLAEVYYLDEDGNVSMLPDVSSAGSSQMAGSGSSEVSGWSTSSMQGSSRSRFQSEGRTVSESDVPFLLPIPFREVSSREFYGLDEQLWRWADELMGAPPRECHIRLPGRPVERILVPWVDERWVSQAAIGGYRKAIAERSKGKSPDEIEALLDAERRARLDEGEIRLETPDDVWRTE